ncbi:fibronectin type III domain-containing protein [Winogradskyella sp.]|jgi:hypothetical protein|uniref:fibronectin type III domain-containing protein n=1 Tax=Winogradskyella sp. TaxID=1883156 RepID=UPI0025D7DEEF|nr:fibronectin type III domain-containing protein [Winogradskyella sp.]MCT4628457.1 fibronectin type III domain-containing protein [Winogradskyella sp.]
MNQILIPKMKKITFLFVLFLIVFSCGSDDDDTIDACVEVTNVQVNNITTSSATVSWADTNEESTYVLEYGISGFVLGSGTTVTETTTSTNLSNLEPSTTYDVYVQAVCSTNNTSLFTDVYSFTTETLPIVPEFRPILSQLNLYTGDLSDLNISSRALKYDLNNELFTDYAHKQRLIALPENTTMQYNGDGLPIFPDNTVIAKTFYYNINEQDLSLGKIIIETRVLIKINGEWETGDYKWNAEQTEAVLDLGGSIVPVTWTDAEGVTNTIDYQIPSNMDCFTCHNTDNIATPIGPKLRNMNFIVDGINQIDDFINTQNLSGVSSSSEISTMVNWEDTTQSLESRTRSYFDINCAHCHIEGGDCDDASTLRLAYETSLEDSQIIERKLSIRLRVSEYNEGFSMPFIGTTMLHDEGVALIRDYLDTLE